MNRMEELREENPRFETGISSISGQEAISRILLFSIRTAGIWQLWYVTAWAVWKAVREPAGQPQNYLLQILRRMVRGPIFRASFSGRQNGWTKR